jgi:hypothetical protein
LQYKELQNIYNPPPFSRSAPRNSREILRGKSRKYRNLQAFFPLIMNLRPIFQQFVLYQEFRHCQHKNDQKIEKKSTGARNRLGFGRAAVPNLKNRAGAAFLWTWSKAVWKIP